MMPFRQMTPQRAGAGDYERMTDVHGSASFTPKFGTYYLVVAHYPRAEKGEGFESILYTATLTVFVPEKCSCCVD